MCTKCGATKEDRCWPTRERELSNLRELSLVLFFPRMMVMTMIFIMMMMMMLMILMKLRESCNSCKSRATSKRVS